MGKRKKAAEKAPPLETTPRDRALQERLERLRLRAEKQVSEQSEKKVTKRRRFFDAL